MSRALKVLRAGPQMTLQDMGREAYLGQGLSRGGAMDRLALWEGAALLGQSERLAALEMAGMGGAFEALGDMRIALTGAPMSAAIDGVRAAWNASHLLPKGAQLTLGAAERGAYGYLHVGGGFDAPEILGARAVHLAAGIGRAAEAGDLLAVGEDARDEVNLCLPEDGRLDGRLGGGLIRLAASVQTALFSDEARARFEAVTFRRDAKGNRMGARLSHDAEGFGSTAGLNVLSEVIVSGDVQITGDGAPFVLLAECGTTGGYPRIGAVLPADLPRVAQARAGEALRFRFVSEAEALEAERREAARRAGLRKAVRPLVRDPRMMRDLLSYQLISGVVSGQEE